MTGIEVEESRDLARGRVHVERVIGADSQRYSILQGPLNYLCLLTDFATEYVDLTESVVDKMVSVACALYNSCPYVVPLYHYIPPHSLISWFIFSNCTAGKMNICVLLHNKNVLKTTC